MINSRRVAPAPGRELDARPRLVLSIVGLLTLCWLIEVPARFASDYGVISTAFRDILGFITLLLLGLTALLVFIRVHNLPLLVRNALALAMVCVILFQASDFLDEFKSTQSIPFLTKGTGLHTAVEMAIIVTGQLLAIAGFFFALLELEYSRQRLDGEHRLLTENLAKRQAMEDELRAAHERLEAEVASRTLELAQRNSQLQEQLSERERAEAALAKRLRFEEGIAACSRVLQADLTVDDALMRVLEHLRSAALAERAFLYENETEADGTRAARLESAAFATGGGAPLPATWAYTGHLDAWAHQLSRGLPALASGTRDDMSPFGRNQVLLLPVGWGGGWRGVIGFEHRTGEGPWSSEETRLLQTAAELIGAYKDRIRAEAALREARDALEQRVAERTADLTHTNARLQKEVTDRIRAEQEKGELEVQLRQAQKMKAIGTLAGGIAHDFNNILSSIIGFAELALLKTPEDTPHRRYLSEVHKAGNRAKELVRQILVFSRQADGDRIPVNMYDITQETLALVRAALPTNILLEVKFEATSGAVLADPVQMHQVVMNLCQNALHAMQETGGHLDITLDVQSLEQTWSTRHATLNAGEYVVLTVKDTGHGMPPTVAERIFEPFFTTKKVGDGTGMGLAIVHGIVNAIGGAILFETAVDEGTTFQLFLPRHHREARERQEDFTPAQLGTGTILVVDDEYQLVEMWTDMLTTFGYNVVPFHHSPDALEAFCEAPERFDLALLDQTMPHLSGADIAQAMLDIRPDFPIILATGFSEAINAEQAKALGIRKFVMKPIIARDLAAAVRSALHEERAHEEISHETAPPQET